MQHECRLRYPSCKHLILAESNENKNMWVKYDVLTTSTQQSNSKGVFNLSNQLSNFSKNWGMKDDKTAFCDFHG